MGKLRDRILRKLFTRVFEAFEAKLANAEDNQNDVTRALLAKNMLSNPIFMEAYEEIKNECNLMWQESGFEDVKVRENVYLTYRTINKLKLKIEAYANKARFDELMKEQEKQFQGMVV